tara:strand:+ start:1701 stop:2192 length:492 start_codon:yes stop_codon:yes gene_type:complete
MLLFHYTHIKTAIDKINKDQKLIVSKTDRDHGLKPAVWFSSDNNFEVTALKGFINNDNGEYTRFKTFEEQLDKIGWVRFVIDDKDGLLIGWKDYVHVSGLNEREWKKMEETHIKLGANPSKWFCSFEDIHYENLLRAEVFTNKWVEMNNDNLKIAIENADWLK